MEHADFSIGLTFWTATEAWRCTDVGTRTIVAVKLGPRELVRRLEDGSLETFVADDPALLNGPPYAIAEHVFDENDIEGCYATEAQRDAEVG